MVATMNYFAGRFATARQLFQQSLELDLSLFMAHSRLAEILEREGRWDEAVLERRRAADGNPDLGSLLVDLGATLTRAGRAEEAADAFDQAALLNPRYAEAFYQAGVTALALGRTDAGRRALERYMELAPRRHAARVAELRMRLDSLGG